MSEISGGAPRHERLQLALWVAAASMLGSLMAVLVVVIQGRSIASPRMVDIAALTLAVICSVGVLVVTARQERLRADRASGTESLTPAAEPRRPATSGTTTTTSTPPTVVQPGRAGQPPTVSKPTTPRPTARKPTAPASDESPITFAGVGKHPDLGSASTARSSWHEAAARGVAGSDRRPASLAGVSSHLALPAGQQPTTDGPAPAEASRQQGHQEIQLGTVPAGSPTRQIVQCPRCGAFDIHAQLVRDGCVFECLSCGHPWHWRPNAPWPVTVLRPRLRRSRESGGSAAAPAVWQLPS